MRHRSTTIGMVSPAVLAMMLASPAIAQVAEQSPQSTVAAEPTVADPAAAQDQPAATTQDGSTQDGTTDDIVVTGVRASLQGAQAIKRNSTQIVDSIVAEDIGKLPDNTVSDALQRVTGVQVQRAGGEAATVLIRGLPNIQSYINGREVFTGTGRGVALQDIPAELIAGVDVYKTATPELIEGGVAGLIDIRFRRPFDLDGLQVAGGLRGIYGDQVGKWSYIASGLVSNRWETGAGEFGILIGGSFNKRKYEDQTAFNFGFLPRATLNPATGSPLFIPETVGAIYNQGDRERPAGNISLQWRPTPNLEFYADGIFTGFRQKFDVNFFIGLPNAGAIQPGAIAQEGTNFAKSVTTRNAFTITSKQAFRQKTDNYNAAFGTKWTTDQAVLTAEVSYNKSDVKSQALIVDTAFIAPQIVFDFDRGGTPNLAITGVDIANPAIDAANPNGLFLITLFDNANVAESEQYAARADLLHEFGGGFVKNFKIGARYARRTGSAGATNPSALPIPGVPATRLPGLTTLSPSNIIDGDVGIDRFVLADSNFLFENTDQIRAFANRPAGNPAFDPNQVFQLKDQVYAFYGQTAFGAEGGALPIDGVLGARIVNTVTNLSAFQTLNGVTAPIDRKQNYVDVLPSLSLRVRPLDNVQLRFVAGKSITRPEFISLNPSVGLFRAGNTTLGTGTGGNGDLQRIKSDNYDVTAEWYFSRTGSITVAGFRRDLDGYIVSFASDEIFPDLNGNPVVYSVTRPRNTDKSKLQGVEVAYQQFFDFLPGPLSGFGAQANFTYSDSTYNAPGDLGTLRLPQVSKYAYNLVGIYEKYGFSARLAYNWRSKFTDSYIDFAGGPANNDRDSINVSSLAFLDFSASYALTDNLTVTVDATNLLDETYQDQFGTDGATPRDTRKFDRTFGAGVRFKF
jgi:TonB-dependent receptor